MLNNYKKQLISIVAVFGLISYAIYSIAAPKEVKKPAGKEVKQVTTKDIVVTPDPKKDPNRKKPTLKKKYADKTKK